MNARFAARAIWNGDFPNGSSTISAQEVRYDCQDIGRRGCAGCAVIAGSYRTAPNASDSPQNVGGAFGVGGAFLVEGAPFTTVLPDRTIALYPLRYFTAALNPKRDLVLLTHPAGGTDLLVSRTDGSEQRKVFQYDSTQSKLLV